MVESHEVGLAHGTAGVFCFVQPLVNALLEITFVFGDFVHQATSDARHPAFNNKPAHRAMIFDERRRGPGGEGEGWTRGERGRRWRRRGEREEGSSVRKRRSNAGVRFTFDTIFLIEVLYVGGMGGAGGGRRPCLRLKPSMLRNYSRGCLRFVHPRPSLLGPRDDVYRHSYSADRRGRA